MVLPFSSKAKVTITEGWYYSQAEKAIHGKSTHGAVDFAAPRGTPVYAADDGYALSSYHSENGGIWQDKEIGLGYGKFVQIWNPNTETFTLYSHLENIAENVIYQEPTKSGGFWNSELLSNRSEPFLSKGTRVTKGDLIGYVGDSGLNWGYDETPTQRPDPKDYPSWDEAHLHFEVFHFDINGKQLIDPYGLNADVKAYKLSSIKTGKTLWINDGEKAQFAR